MAKHGPPVGGVPYDPDDPSTYISTSPPPNTGAIDEILNTNAPDIFNDTTNQTVHSGELDGVNYTYFPADDEHGEQLAVYNPDGSTTWYVNDGDTPRYGGGGSLQSNPACDNPGEDIWVTMPPSTPPPTTPPPTGPQITIRTQTWGIRSAVQGVRETPLELLTAIATTPMRDLVLDATIAGNPAHEFLLSSTIRGTLEKEFKLKSAIRKTIDVPLKMSTAIAHDFEIAPKIDATVQGNPWVHTHLGAFIQGEAEKAFTISAIILKDRTETIYLEMENLFPQECDLRGIPNAPSKFKDWRKETFGR